MRLNRGYPALFLTLLIWGSTFVVTKVILHEIAPLALTFTRFAIAFAVLAPLACRQGYRLRDTFRPSFLLFGLTGTTLFYALQNLGLKYTSVSSTVLIQSSIPAITAVLAVIVLKERLSARQIAGIALVTLGVILVGLAGEEPSASSPHPALGNLLIFGTALSWAAYTIQGRKMAGERPALVMTAASTGAGLLFLLPFTAWELSTTGLPHLSPGGALGVAYLGLVASGLTMFLWNYALHFLPASVATPFINLIPIIGLVSALILGEQPPLVQVAGGALAILGVWLSSVLQKEEPIPQNPLKQSEQRRIS
ncbi:MAG TPA: DMT family transporter [Anaerolineaceae bacterium]|nr:DMT family transporter [Anaerolineaceae bacterium]